MVHSIYQLIAATSKMTGLFNELNTTMLTRYSQALHEFCVQAEKEVHHMRLQATVTTVTGVLTGTVGSFLALMPAVENLAKINNVATEGMLQNLAKVVSDNHDTIKGALKASQKALPLIGNAGQTVVQSSVTKAQTAKTLAERTQLNSAEQMQRQLEDSIARVQDTLRRAQEASART